jgi:hypothetical protein
VIDPAPFYLYSARQKMKRVKLGSILNKTT